VVRDKKIKLKKVILASDHAGFKLKEEIKKFLIKKRKKVLDLEQKIQILLIILIMLIFYLKK